VEYQLQELLLAAEFARDYATYKTTLLLPEVPTTVQGFYVMGSYQVRPWFTPGLYYSVLFPNIEQPIRKRSTYQHDVAMTLRYDLTPNWLVKLEGHYMHGTAALTSALNGNQPLDDLSKNWGVFLLKTTGYF
jgi:predicted porin